MASVPFGDIAREFPFAARQVAIPAAAVVAGGWAGSKLGRRREDGKGSTLGFAIGSLTAALLTSAALAAADVLKGGGA